MQNNDFITRVKREVSLENYISRFVKLKKTGKRSLGLCPFHSEKSPSFTVSAELQMFHCFGCGASGDIFSFVMKYEKVEFPRSLELLSEYSGIPLDKTNSTDQSFKQELYKLNETILDYFRKNLQSTEGEDARLYLKTRGLGESDIKKFEIGLSLPGFDNLTRSILTTKEKIDQGQILGLLKKREKDSYYDFYRDRIIFPIRDTSGKVVGFGGRLYKESKEAKYINSPASAIYDKGKMFYGLYQSAPTIRREREAILVEGYLDVIGLHSKGIETAVAPLGTSLTQFQIRNLKNFADKVLLLLDGDSAGKKAALRACEICIRENFETSVVLLENNVDPFDLSQSKTRAEISEIFDKKTDSTKFFLKETLNHATASSGIDEKRKAVEFLFGFVKTLDKQTDRELYLGEGAKILGIQKESFLKDFQNDTKLSFGTLEVDKKREGKESKLQVPKSRILAERKLVSLILLHNEFVELLWERGELEFQDTDSAYVLDFINSKLNDGEIVTESILNEIPEQIRGAILPHLMDSSEEKDIVIGKQNFSELVLRLLIEDKKKAMNEVSNKLSLNSELWKDMMNLKKEINNLEEEFRSRQPIGEKG
ncbi:MAG: DNA primase [Leptospiraceae bacterium]|nr:DNA primase [Leptospiraceae bacterium]